jgi:hypothetical protein
MCGSTKQNFGKSKFTHLIDKGHSITPMEILHVTKNYNMMNTLKKFHIYNVKRLDDQVNEKDPVKHNVIFDHTVNIYITL